VTRCSNCPTLVHVYDQGKVVALNYGHCNGLLRLVLLAKSLLTQQDRRLLLETRNVLEDLLETEAVLRDKVLMESIKRSRRDVRAGRVYTVAQLKRKLREQRKL
jgi:hypothetical protein